MSLQDDIASCAQTVHSGDPMRFLSAMTASGADRDALMVLYAFNVEVSRAPWVTEEPMIAEMRLQWWIDAVEEIFTGATVRRHQVVTPLAELAARKQLPRARFDALIAARRWDIYKEPHADDAALWAYLADTAGGLMALGVQAVDGGSLDEETLEAAHRYGTGCGAAALLEAVPALEASNRYPLVDGTAQGVTAFAATALEQLEAARRELKTVARPKRAALRSGWLAHGVLRQAVREPVLVGAGMLGRSDAGKRLRLMGLAATGGF
ncbi:phytoene/squalene synthase family protein [Neptunicoccus cionae]|uniref:phytoene/squalene synthase family protein n=1 Tax=Neptunicoccus cionae TaxID=2035344 RepID=UPI000C78D5C0|nr:squalene/phytoene synthase family protein [Amylibacter cionae]PLS22239.1 phytoene synthase [Amylibacter cionae]